MPHLQTSGLPGVRLYSAYHLDEATGALHEARCQPGKAETLVYWRPTHGHENDAWDEAAGPASARAEEETFNKDKVFQHVTDDWGIFVHVAHSANAGADADADRGVGAAVDVDKIPNEALRKRIRAYAADVSKKPMAPAGVAG